MGGDIFVGSGLEFSAYGYYEVELIPLEKLKQDSYRQELIKFLDQYKIKYEDKLIGYNLIADYYWYLSLTI